MVAQLLLSILATMIVMWFSRWREFRADAGGANLAGRNKMVGALRALQRAHEPQELPGAFAAFGIHNGGMSKLFMSHPPGRSHRRFAEPALISISMIPSAGTKDKHSA